ncbi:hypothetical protein DdX_12639 [Ditylenchus destructor]|uniref:Uncharacterized protein n=1 Tax=Ditylenchus destructor TaxID=166010 RepID=A0AAD4N0A1_9BILA|nr:hypothetical protein DdX_12639 [Ditylenchus destructor]
MGKFTEMQSLISLDSKYLSEFLVLLESTSSSAPIKSSLLLASHYKPLAKLTRTLLNSKRKRTTKKSYKGHTKSLNTNLGLVFYRLQHRRQPDSTAAFSSKAKRLHIRLRKRLGSTPHHKADFGFSPTHRRIGFTKGNSRVLRRQRPSIEVERASGLKEDLSKGTAQHLIGLSGSSRSSYNSEAAQLSDEDSIHRSKRTLSNLSAEASQLEQKRLNRRYSIGSLSIRRSTRPPIATLKHRLTPRGLNCFNRPASRKHHPTNAKRLQQKRRLSARSASQTSSIPLQSVRS